MQGGFLSKEKHMVPFKSTLVALNFSDFGSGLGKQGASISQEVENNVGKRDELA